MTVISAAIMERDSEQGDQIGLIFASWVIACFGQLFENYERSPNVGAAYFRGKRCALILAK
jgi:hypothetical protein